MNDEFLKKHRVRPDAEFVEALYENLEQSENRRFRMFSNRPRLRLRSIFASTFVLMGLALFVFMASPTAKNKVQSWWQSNENSLIAINSEEFEPVAIGTQISNTPTTINTSQPSDPDIGYEYLPYDRLTEKFPEFVLPTDLPEGYQLSPDGAQHWKDGSVAVVWLKEKENFIAYSHGDNSTINRPGTDLYNDHAPYFYESTAPSGKIDMLNLNGVLDGYFHSISTDDLTLTEELLLSLVPDAVRAAPPFVAEDIVVFSSDEPTHPYSDSQIDYLNLEDSPESNKKAINVSWKVSGPGSYSLYWRPEAELVIIDSGPEGEYAAQLELPEQIQKPIPITLFVTGDNGGRIQKTIEFSMNTVGQSGFVSVTDENRAPISPAAINQRPDQYRINGLKNEPQKFNNQGPATVSILLNYFGNDTTQDEAASYLKPNPDDRNVNPWQISEYVNEVTELRSIARPNGSPELLRRLIANDFPVVIEKGYDAEISDAFGWYGHYLIMYGFDDVNQEFNAIDTFLGPFKEADIDQSSGDTLEDGFIYSYDHVSTYWQQFNRTFYLVYDPAREEELFAILGDHVALSADNWLVAVEQAQADIQKDNTNPFAWFNLGTSFTELGKLTSEPAHFENGAEAFDRAFEIGLPDRMLWYQHGPFVAYLEVDRYQDVLELAETTLADVGGRTIEEVWLYKGHAQSYLQDFEAALVSYNQALKLNENLYPAQFSKDQLELMLNGDS